MKSVRFEVLRLTESSPYTYTYGQMDKLFPETAPLYYKDTYVKSVRFEVLRLADVQGVLSVLKLYHSIITIPKVFTGVYIVHFEHTAPTPSLRLIF